MLTVFKFLFWCWMTFMTLVWRIYALFSSKTVLQFAFELCNDPQVREMAIRAGMAGALAQLEGAMRAMAASNAPSRPEPSDEAVKWAQFVQDFGSDPSDSGRADLIPKWIEYAKSLMDDPSQEFPTAGAGLAFCERYPLISESWDREFIARCMKVLKNDSERPGWNDYYMARWFVLRDDSTAKTIASLPHAEGPRGYTARWMVNSVCQQMPAFREAMARVGYDFGEATGPVLTATIFNPPAPAPPRGPYEAEAPMESVFRVFPSKTHAGRVHFGMSAPGSSVELSVQEANELADMLDEAAENAPQEITC